MGVPTIQIRQAEPVDAPVVLAFIHGKADLDGSSAVEATEDRLRDALAADPAPFGVLLASIEGREVGFATSNYTYASFLTRRGIWLDDLFDDPEWRGRSVGTASFAFSPGALWAVRVFASKAALLTPIRFT